MSIDVFDSTRPKLAQAADDLIEGVRRWPLWGRLGWIDIVQRYRRSVLGPFWITMSMAVLVASLGLLYSLLFKLDIQEYLPFLAIGFIVWGLVSGIVLESCSVFIDAEGVLKQMPGSVSMHVFRIVWRNVLYFFHNVIVFFVVALLFDVGLGWASLLSILGLILIVVNGVWVGLLLGLLCARFRDATPLVASLIQLSFFVTPIIWKPEMLPDRAIFLILNPFFHLIELARAPLLGGTPELISWAVCIALAVTGWLITLPVLGLSRAKLVYWL